MVVDRQAQLLDKVTVPIEDVGVVLLDNSQITITHNAIKSLQDNNVSLISCDDKHMPSSLMLPLEGHSLQSKRYRHQIEASVPLRKNLWQQTVAAKIHNQMLALKKLGRSFKRLEVLAGRVQSGDPQNVEAQAASYYWSQYLQGFQRDRYGEPPNHLLNYGYAILRSMVARALVGSGLIPGLGIHHKNQYNAYCLADDIMEPYRPFIDLLAHERYMVNEGDHFISMEDKKALLSVATMDAQYQRKKSPLMVGLSMTTASLAQCYEGKRRRIHYPKIIE